MLQSHYQRQPDPISLATVLVEPSFDGQDLGVSGTGIVIVTHAGPMLVTAAHVLTGRHPNGKGLHSEGALPNRVTLTNFSGRLAQDIPLYASGNDPNADKPLMLRHSRKWVDVTVLPLPSEVTRHPANRLHESLWRPESYSKGIPTLRVSEVCHIVGYPEGLTNQIGPNQVLPLWKTGHIATDPHFDFTNSKLEFDREPLCLVDATTRPGLSGAPVFVVQRGEISQEWILASAQIAAEISAGQHPRRRSTPFGAVIADRTRWLGIYSGRTSDSSDLGIVWKPTVLHDILNQTFDKW